MGGRGQTERATRGMERAREERDCVGDCNRNERDRMIDTVERWVVG